MNLNELGQLNYLKLSEVGITDGLIGWWKLDDDAKDYSGNNNHGTIQGLVTVNAGVKNTSMKFTDGTTYINIPNDIGYTTQVSAFAWFKQIGIPGSGYHIIFGASELEISIPTSGELRVGIITDIRYCDNHGSGLVDGNWHHVGFTFSNGIKIGYIDGIEAGRISNIPGVLVYNFANRRIGVYGTSTGYYTNGLIDDVRIYNRALSPEEVGIMYNIGSENIAMQLSSDGTLYLKGQIKEV